MFDVPGLHVLAVAREAERLVLMVETAADVTGCPACGVVAVGHGRREHTVHDAPCFTVPTVVVWRKRIWRCAEPACPTGTFSEAHPLAKLTARAVGWAVGWAVDALGHDDTTVSALARHLGVDWHTLWDAVKVAARAATGNRYGSERTRFSWDNVIAEPLAPYRAAPGKESRAASCVETTVIHRRVG